MHTASSNTCNNFDQLLTRATIFILLYFYFVPTKIYHHREHTGTHTQLSTRAADGGRGALYYRERETGREGESGDVYVARHEQQPRSLALTAFIYCFPLAPLTHTALHSHTHTYTSPSSSLLLRRRRGRCPPFAACFFFFFFSTVCWSRANLSVQNFGQKWTGGLLFSVWIFSVVFRVVISVVQPENHPLHNTDNLVLTELWPQFKY